MKKYEQKEKAHQFLMGLNDDRYSSITSQILTLGPLPSLDCIFNMIVQEENHISMMFGLEDRNENAVAFAMMHGERAKGTVIEKGNCTHCGRYGHEGSAYYEIIGYPLRWGNRNRGRG